MQRIRELARSSQRHRHLAIKRSVKHHHIRIIEFSSSFFDNIILSIQSAKKRKRGKRQISLEKERIKGESGRGGDMFLYHSSWQSREREKGREWLGEWEGGWARETEREDTRADDERTRASATDILIFTHTHTQKTKEGRGREERATSTRTFTLSRVAQHVASKSRVRIWKRDWGKDTLARSRTKASRDERLINSAYHYTCHPNDIVSYKLNCNL